MFGGRLHIRFAAPPPAARPTLRIARPRPDVDAARQGRPQPSRRGFLNSAELVLVLPILAVLLAGLVEFSLLFFARGEIVDAARAAARIASYPGATDQDIEREVRRMLSPRLQRGMKIRWKPGEHPGDVVVVGIAVPMTAATPDLLWPIGLSVRGRQLYAEARMRRE